MTDPNQPKSYPVIVRFKKADLMRFIGHLDWQALELTIFLRAGLKLTVSEGPTHRLKFKTSPPTPVGVASNTELAYIKLAEPLYPTEVARRLAAVCPDGIFVALVMDATLLPVKNPFGVIEACRYELDPGIDTPSETIDGIYRLLVEIRSAEIPDDLDPEEVKPFWGRILDLERSENSIYLLVNQLEGVTFHAAKCAAFLESRLGLAHYPLFTKLDYYRLKPRAKRLFA